MKERQFLHAYYLNTRFEREYRYSSTRNTFTKKTYEVFFIGSQNNPKQRSNKKQSTQKNQIRTYTLCPSIIYQTYHIYKSENEYPLLKAQ